MSFNGLIHFRNENLDSIQSQTLGQQDEYTRIWQDVQRQIMGLVAAGQVDAQIGATLEERDRIFQQQAAGYDESVTSQNTAIRNVQNIGNEGGAAMVRAAAGGRA
ncbi:hypothetical protein E1265_28595 [Streptomyces sp. 8K308]|uniref:hypothetical protein n=1 Tax=Streptomyces sp. 8K308 TaxID=2530388 RepID=UPI001053B945|nr:hypothetical protein [Streptomyces sp. 8K308]TDC13084.1 hypothetical protein E1265_28595 [Streptomyces sp. 8K308]